MRQPLLSLPRQAIVIRLACLAVWLAVGGESSAQVASPPGAAKPDPRKEAFFRGTIGTEVMPLPVALVLPDIYPEHFQPLGKDQGDWIDQFGFIRSQDPASQGLPLGFTISDLTPGTGAKSPVKFVGLGCATCHTALIRRSIDDEGFLVVGTGNPALNLFAWLDAFQAATMQKLPDLKDPTNPARMKLPVGVHERDLLTVDRVATAYKSKFAKDLSEVEKQVVGGWLKGIALQQAATYPRFDQPFGHGLSLLPANVPTGPGRTQPFRTLVRTVLERPGSTMDVFTKVAPVFTEEMQTWAQVDGGIQDIRLRSALAAMAAGASLDILKVPEVAANIEQSTNYTKDLRGPTYADAFPDLAGWRGMPAIERGRGVYYRYCAECHGSPNPTAPGGWSKSKRFGVIIPYEEIATDPRRVTFRYFDELPQQIFEVFQNYPGDHPFKFPREELRPGPLGTRKGYITKPLNSVFARAPYLHNASVLTLAELINLRPRRAVFYRGQAIYDPENVGLLSPDAPDKIHYFKFDTSLDGNSNLGHDYPWSYRGPGWDEHQLRDLLEYLKEL